MKQTSRSTEMKNVESLNQSIASSKFNRRREKLNWWRDSKFGMFVHWGIYSKIGGVWQGDILPQTHIGEWIMLLNNISLEEYEHVARDFKADKFDAEEWVLLLKEAGMKYIVVTAKHHEGFAMYQSECSSFNIVDYPKHKNVDPLKELSEACQKHGIKFCLYYSHMIDFHHPHAFRNEFAHPSLKDKDVEIYIREKCKPQLKELLTGYGTVDMIWFDMPEQISKKQAEDIKTYVHSFQEDCIIGGRLGQKQEEYMTMGDNEYPLEVMDWDWESPGTTNDTWGYKFHDHNFKSPEQMIRLLVHITARGGNYLLNVGPKESGEIPEDAVKNLKSVGQWLKKNGEAIYNTSCNPLTYNPKWGEVTAKGNKLYLHVFNAEQKEVKLTGLNTKILKAYRLADETPVNFYQNLDEDLDLNYSVLETRDSMLQDEITVFVLELEDTPKVESALVELPEGEMVLSPYRGEINRASEESKIKIESLGLVTDWINEDDSIIWQIKVDQPGIYQGEMITRSKKYNKVFNGEWDGGHKFELCVNNESYDFVLEENRRFRPKDLYYYDYIGSKIGTVCFKEAGLYKIALKAKDINKASKYGLTFVNLVLKKKED